MGKENNAENFPPRSLLINTFARFVLLSCCCRFHPVNLRVVGDLQLPHISGCFASFFQFLFPPVSKKITESISSSRLHKHVLTFLRIILHVVPKFSFQVNLAFISSPTFSEIFLHLVNFLSVSSPLSSVVLM